MTKVEFARRAQTDLDDIDIYLRREAGVGRARAMRRRIRDRIDVLQQNPQLGRERQEYGGRRLLNVRPYAILYRYRPDQALIIILRIVHGARDIAALSMD